MNSILLVEDELSLIDGLDFSLKKNGFHVDIARTVQEAYAIIENHSHDLLILDLTLPDGSGYEICKRVRQSSAVPIIFLTASDEEVSIVKGLDMGADDYITKPFKLNELISRINALLRRAKLSDGAQTELLSNGITVRLAENRVFKENSELELTTTEYRLLCFFMQNPNVVLTRDIILDTFDASRLTAAYKESVGGISETKDGLFVPPEKSWFISYDQNQLNWAKTDLIAGELSEEKLSEQDGLIAVARPVRKGISMETAALQLGDKVYVKTPGGTKEMTVMAILRTVPFNDSQPSVTTFITTEKIFAELTGESALKIIDVQLDKSGQERTVNEIRSMIGESVAFSDQRQKNSEANQAFMTMAVFIYGFVIVIALISILNIINTMNTSVASKKQYLGVLRAVGMSGAQLDKMVFMEAATYSLLGSIVGCILGIALQKTLITNLLSEYQITWQFPSVQIGLILIIILLVTTGAVIGPLKRIKAQGAAEVIGSL